MKSGFFADHDLSEVYASTMLPLLAATLGGVLFLINSKGGIRNRKQRRATLTGLLILFWAGLTLFALFYFRIARPVWVISAFDLARHFVSGVCVAMTTFVVWPNGATAMLTISGVGLVGFNLYAFAHYDLRHLAPAIRLYCMANGLGIGIAMASAASLWRRDKALEDRPMRQDLRP